jgi:hypothetical protein
MKKSMKKFMVACAAVSAMTVAAGVSAMAAEYSADTNTATYTVPAATDSTQMTVLVIPEGAENNVQDSDILYINQDAKGGAVNGTAALKAVDGGLADGTYLVKVGYYDADNVFRIAEDTFTVGNDTPTPAYTLGDVNADGEIDSQDALLILEYEVGAKDLTDTQKLAADTNKDSDYDSQDALLILEYEVGNITSF